nr:hypothetical protein [Tanacetum cinerariifolium]
PSPTPTTQPPPPLQELPSTSQVIPTPPPSPIAEQPQPQPQQQQQQSSQPTHDAEISMDLLHTLMETCTTLTRKVEALEQDKVAQALEIIKLKVESSGDTVTDDVSKKKEIISNIDADEDVTLKDVAVVEKTAEIEENANVLGRQDDELEPTKLKEVVEVVTIAKLIIEVVTAAATITAATITAAPKKIKEQLEEEESRALKRKTERSKEKAVKKQKLDEEVEELKKHLQAVPNDEDDVYTKDTPLAHRVFVVDYEIYTENNKLYYKIIRAGGSPQLFLSFLSLLRNFDREELEVLWQLVKDKFASSKPKNFSDDFMLTTLTYKFEKHDFQAQVWKNQRSVHGLAKVKS